MVVGLIKKKIMGDSFPTTVMIITRRGNGHMVTFDKAGFFNKSKLGERVYVLKNKKQIVKPMSFDNILQTTMGRPFVALYEYERGEFTPIDFSSLSSDSRKKKLAEMTIDEDVRNWRVVQDRVAESLHKKESTWEKYGSLIMMFLMFLFIIIMAWMFMKNISEVGFEITNALEGMKGAAPAG